MHEIAAYVNCLTQMLQKMYERMNENTISDIIKSLPVYDGKTISLMYWLRIAEKRLKFFESRVAPEVFEMYTSAVIDKIQGEPKKILLNSRNFNHESAISFKEVKLTLLEDLSQGGGIALPVNYRE